MTATLIKTLLVSYLFFFKFVCFLSLFIFCFFYLYNLTFLISDCILVFSICILFSCYLVFICPVFSVALSFLLLCLTSFCFPVTLSLLLFRLSSYCVFMLSMSKTSNISYFNYLFNIYTLRCQTDVVRLIHTTSSDHCSYNSNHLILDIIQCNHRLFSSFYKPLIILCNLWTSSYSG